MKSKELQLVNLEQARMLKAAGFDLKCNRYYFLGMEAAGVSRLRRSDEENYNDKSLCLSAPTVALAFKWFRDEKDIECYCGTQNLNKGIVHYFSAFRPRHFYEHQIDFNTYEAAEHALLDFLIEKYFEEPKF